MLWLFTLAADAAPTVFDASSIAPAISALGNTTLTGALCYYVITVAIPKMLEAHAVERDKMQSRYDAIIDKLVAELNAARTQFFQHRDCKD